MSRPERSKRPPVAADGTELAAAIAPGQHKRARTGEDATKDRGSASPSPTVYDKGEHSDEAVKLSLERPAIQASSIGATRVDDVVQDAVAGPSRLTSGDIRSEMPSNGIDVTVIESDDESDILVGEQEGDGGQAQPLLEAKLLASPLAKVDRSILAKHLPEARRRMLSVLVGATPPAQADGGECLGLQDQWRALRSTLRGTLQGEGNSALLVGAPGSGKSLLIHSVLRSLSDSKPFHVVHLDAALQTTDRLSLRELARQLLRSGAIKPSSAEALDLDLQEADDEDEDGDEHIGEDAVPNGEMDAATLEGKQEDVDDEGLEGAVLSSLANTTSAILTLLSSGDSKGRPLVIVLSSFELLTARPRQALLYVLLDAVQAGSYTPGLCVLGTTSRVDTSDLLEKRVRSRFSGRVIDVWPGAASWPEALRKVLSLGCTGDESFDAAWRAELDAAVKDSKVLAVLEEWKSTENDFGSLYRALIPIVASLTPDSPSVHAALLAAAAGAGAEHSTLDDLTTPEFALLIAAKHLFGKDREVFNFAMCFEELKQFVARTERDRLGASTSAVGAGPGQQRSIGVSWTSLRNRPRVLMAFRRLLNLELFQPDSLLTTQTDVAALTSATAAGARRSTQAVGTEFLRVRCTLFPQTIVEAARNKARVEPLGMHLVQWAQASG